MFGRAFALNFAFLTQRRHGAKTRPEKTLGREEGNVGFNHEAPNAANLPDKFVIPH
jgi:hypothetical protein